MYRSDEYDQKLAKKLQNPKRAGEFLLGLTEGRGGLEPLDALKHTIKRMGVKEFSSLAGIPSTSVSRMLNSDNVPKIETLKTYFGFFGLDVYIGVGKKRAA